MSVKDRYPLLKAQSCNNLETVRESAHLTLLHRTMQKHLDMLNHLGVDQECDRQTGRRTKGQSKAV